MNCGGTATYLSVPPLVTYWIVSTDYSKATISLSVSTIQPKPIAGRSVRGVLFMLGVQI